MLNVNDILTKWLTDLQGYRFPDYERFPDIELYMEQVITYLDRSLSIFSTSSMDKQITSSMINNYVKGQVISAPISKKYSKEHLALLEETYALKQVLTINEIKQILDVKYKDGNNADAFNQFKRLYGEKLDEASQTTKNALKNVDENDTEALTDIAVNLAAAANAYITIAKRILFLLNKNEEIKAQEEKEKEEEPTYSVGRFKKLYEQNIGLINGIVAEWLFEISELIDYELFKRAIEIATDKGKCNKGYVAGIIKQWLDNNIRSYEDLKAYEIGVKNRREESGEYSQYKYANANERENDDIIYRAPSKEQLEEIRNLIEESRYRR